MRIQLYRDIITSGYISTSNDKKIRVGRKLQSYAQYIYYTNKIKK